MKKTFLNPEVSSVELNLSEDIMEVSILAEKNTGVVYSAEYADTVGANTAFFTGSDWE